MDFTFEQYEEFLAFLASKKIKVFGILNWFENNSSNGIIIRHDVDRKPKNALKMALLEAKYDIKTTFYFRTTKNSFQTDIIKKIVDLEHEIGYHYEDYARANGDYPKAKLSFRDNLEKLRAYYNIKTVAAHGRPLSKFDSRDFWRNYAIEEFGLKAEALISIDYTDIYYFTDTGRTWNSKGVNIRDNVTSYKKTEVNSTYELIDFINNNKDKKIAIVAHPERWSDSFSEHVISTLKDHATNAVKRILISMRQ